MGKLSKEIDESISAMVDEYAEKAYLSHKGINVKTLAVRKKSKEIVKVAKASEVTELFAGESDMVFIYVYEDAFMRLDELTQRMLIESALATVSMDDNGKLIITPPQLNIPLGMWQQYGDAVVKKMEVAILLLQQMEEEEKEEKERLKAEKEAKRLAKSQKNQAF